MMLPPWVTEGLRVVDAISTSSSGQARPVGHGAEPLESAKFLKSRNPNSVVKLKDLQTGEEIIVAFKSGQQ